MEWKREVVISVDAVKGESVKIMDRLLASGLGCFAVHDMDVDPTRIYIVIEKQPDWSLVLQALTK